MIMKKILFSLLVVCLPIVVCAGTIEIDGIYYNIVEKSKIAEVTSNPKQKYHWEIDIPASIVYGGETYSVTSIGNSAFYDCIDLTKVTIPNSVTSIGKWAFQKCSRLTSIDIPNSVTTIYDYAFAECYGLTSIVIPESVTSVGWWVFYSCSGLISVSIPSSLTVINNYMFCDCSALKSISIPNSVTDIRFRAFSRCNSLTSIDIPSNVKSIGDFAFEFCSGITTVNIPNSVTSIGREAFYACNLTLVKIGSGVKSIGDKAFASNKELTDVYCLAEEVPEMWDEYGYKGTDAFADSHIEDVVLYVPAASVNLYKKVEPWKSFKSIVGVEPETPKCEPPTISYNNGKLMFGCATEGVEYVYEITDPDVAKGYGSEVQLTVTYNISVYSTKIGYDNSDITTASLCWIDSAPKMDNVTYGVAEVKANAVLIQSNNGFVTVQGVDPGTLVNVYNISGMEVGASSSQNGVATINTSLKSGSVAIVKIGNKSIKVVVN